MNEVQKVLFECADGVALVRLNRPEQRNAIDAETCQQLREAFDRFEADSELRVAVLAGNGPVFCAGMDLKAFVNGDAEEILFGPGRLGGFVSRSRKKPVIAAVQGAVFAGGFEIALACDMIIATADARFALPEPKRGLVAGAGGAFRLGQLLPKAIANELLLTGTAIDAHRAATLGLVNKIVDEDPVSAALDLARSISENAPLALEASLHLAGFGRGQVEANCWSENDLYLRSLIGSHDAREGALAFVEKRPPRWTGK